MSTDLKAIPTEYKGVRFRSKSEAIFAFHLEKAGWQWNYESDVAAEIHPWDFWIYKSDNSIGSRDLLIEYKPTRPTASYVQNLRAKIKGHFSKRLAAIYESKPDISENAFRMLARHMQTRFILVWGSPWNPAVAIPKDIDWESWPEDDFVCHSDNATTYKAIDLFLDSVGPSVHQCSLDTENLSLGDLGINDSITEQSRSYRFDLKH
jgi:hypothetical protein